MLDDVCPVVDGSAQLWCRTAQLCVRGPILLTAKGDSPVAQMKEACVFGGRVQSCNLNDTEGLSGDGAQQWWQ